MSETEPTGADTPQLRLPRRRRSATRTPALLEPAQLADDAAGRVEVIAIRAPADVLEPPEPAVEPPPQRESRAVALLLSENGWIAIGALAAILVVVFLIGLRFTH